MFRLSSVSSKLLLSVAISVIVATALMIAIVSFQVASYSEQRSQRYYFFIFKKICELYTRYFK